VSSFFCHCQISGRGKDQIRLVVDERFHKLRSGAGANPLSGPRVYAPLYAAGLEGAEGPGRED
jgi:hypothetical protein